MDKQLVGILAFVLVLLVGAFVSHFANTLLTVLTAVVCSVIIMYLGNKYKWLENVGDINPECTGG